MTADIRLASEKTVPFSDGRFARASVMHDAIEVARDWRNFIDASAEFGIAVDTLGRHIRLEFYRRGC